MGHNEFERSLIKELILTFGVVEQRYNEKKPFIFKNQSRIFLMEGILRDI
jgi:hypothetical protein